MASVVDSFEFGTSVRRNIIIVLAVVVAVVFTLRLVQLQFVEGRFYQERSERAIKPLSTKPLRGTLYDRHGKTIVHNIPYFAIAVTPKDFTPESRRMLAHFLDVEVDEIDKRLAKKKPSAFTSTAIFNDVDYAVVASIEENWDLLPGVEIMAQSKRTYPNNSRITHLLGYIKEINERQLGSEGDYYEPGDMIGYNGLEKTYEHILRGKKGVEYAAYNRLGQKVASFNDGKNDIASHDGFDLNLALDLDLQEYAESLLDGQRAAAVVLDPQNGEILAFVSKPDYDLLTFSGRTPVDVYRQLRDDEGKPFLNRVTNAIYPPGSPWKMLVALAGLQEGIISEHTSYQCTGSVLVGGRPFKCHGGVHGPIAVRRALKVSCNSFFYRLALKLGIDRMSEYGRLFGFGSKASIDIHGESKGIMPSRQWMNKQYGQKNWTDSRVVNWGIGQGEVTVTPLQLATYTAALANGGKLVQPHAVRTVHNRQTGSIDPVAYGSETLPIEAQYLQIIREGMYDVVNELGGTARSARIPDIEVCGKTGTAQNPHGRDHAWFTCFAPRTNPSIVVTVIVENSGYGGAVAGPVCRKIMRKYFGLDPEENPYYTPAPVDSISPAVPAPADSSSSLVESIGEE